MEGFDTIEPITVSNREKVSSILNMIDKTDYPIVVLHGKKYYGVIDARTIRQHSNIDFTKTKTGTIAERAPRLMVGESLDDVVKKFAGCRFKALPVIDENNKVIGMISLHALIKSLVDMNLVPSKKVAEVMSSPVISVHINSTIAQTITSMKLKGLRRMVVVDDKGFLKGIISIKDILEFAKSPKERHPMISSQKYSFRTLSIEPMVNVNVETITASSSLKEAALYMYKKKLASLIIVERRKPIGIITLRDLLNTYLISREVQKINISGLTGFDKNYYQDIFDMASKYYNKLNKRFSIQNLSLHITKHGYRYTVHARVMFPKKSIVVSDFAWDLTEAVFKTLESLRTAILRLKPDNKYKIIKKKKRQRKKQSGNKKAKKK